MEDDALTAVVRRPKPTTMNKTLAVLLGLVGVLAPAVTGYFSYRQAKIEASAESKNVRGDAAIGYRTLADPVELAITLIKAHDVRITALEAEIRECAAKQSLPPPAPVGLVPFDRALLHPLPRTLGEAAALAK